jgi:hypothetical protein
MKHYAFPFVGLVMVAAVFATGCEPGARHRATTDENITYDVDGEPRAPRGQRPAARAPAEYGQLVAEGRPPLSFVWSQPGTIRIVDVDESALIHTAIWDDLVQPLLVTIDGDQQAVLVEDVGDQERYVLLSGIQRDHRYAIWFQPAGHSVREAEVHRERPSPVERPRQ